MRNNNVVVSLDGHGADELLGGYHFIIAEEMQNHLFPCPRLFRYMDLRRTIRGFEGGSNLIDPNILHDFRISFVNYSRERMLGKIYRYIKHRPSLYTSDMNSANLNLQHQLLDRTELRDLSHLNRNLYTYFHDTVLPTILRNFDRASMAHGVEVRIPFMDWRLVTFCFSLPDRSKIGNGYAKRILRESMRNILHDSIRLRTNKVGFTSPMVEWFKGPLQKFLIDSVNSRRFLTSDNWDGVSIRNFVEKCIHDQEWTSLEDVWPYLNAHILIEKFDEHRNFRSQ